ncbi:unnamed protein product [Prunus armeniaca]|uniref:Uncharacterized protein n=1 Tax=Prunus armeniaca TaxID=36596 RepID=A0A6J5UI93_PRUAR|nr:unnamed protein product [Prunus armeniaca]
MYSIFICEAKLQENCGANLLWQDTRNAWCPTHASHNCCLPIGNCPVMQLQQPASKSLLSDAMVEASSIYTVQDEHIQWNNALDS